MPLNDDRLRPGRRLYWIFLFLRRMTSLTNSGIAALLRQVAKTARPRLEYVSKDMSSQK